MQNKTAFIGHRNVFFVEEVWEKLLEAIESRIESGCKGFIMGKHGYFDSMALEACKDMRARGNDIEIEVVLTGKGGGEALECNVKTISYDMTDVFYKRKILESNRKMIEESDTLICYVDENREKSGAKEILRYARKRGLQIINLFP